MQVAVKESIKAIEGRMRKKTLFFYWRILPNRLHLQPQKRNGELAS